MRRLPRPRCHGALELIRKRFTVFRVTTVADNDRRALARRKAAQVGQSMLGDQNIDVSMARPWAATVAQMRKRRIR
ncbi:hypothetical protein BC361_15875 [Ensifer sp. LC54]|nr:hypothetical protein BC363_16620 [Ensifer sp. LC384]OCP26539.1 hypothetical protein BC361_15875 [Ensifer sp. LC54]